MKDELHSRAQLPAHVEPLIRSLPDNMHPMTMLTQGASQSSFVLNPLSSKQLEPASEFSIRIGSLLTHWRV